MYRIIILVVPMFHAVLGVLSEEYRLYDHLFKHYNKLLRPVRNTSHRIDVQVEFVLKQVLELNAKEQTLRTNFWLYKLWRDDFLTWNETEFPVKQLILAEDNVWLPEAVMFDSLNADTRQKFGTASHVQIESNGMVLQSINFIQKTPCQVDVSRFPFDTQSCKIHIGAWMHDVSKLLLKPTNNTVNLKGVARSCEWDLIDVSANFFNQSYLYSPSPFSEVIFTIYVRRLPMFFITNIAIPACMINVLSLATFWLPPESGERVTVGLTTLLAFSVLLSMIAEKIPECSNNIPLISKYLTFSMAINLLCVIMSVVATRVSLRATKCNKERYESIMNGRHKRRFSSSSSQRHSKTNNDVSDSPQRRNHELPRLSDVRYENNENNHVVCCISRFSVIDKFDRAIFGIFLVVNLAMVLVYIFLPALQ